MAVVTFPLMEFRLWTSGYCWKVKFGIFYIRVLSAILEVLSK